MPKETTSPVQSGKRARVVRVKHSTNPFLQDVVAKLGDKRVAVAFKSGMLELDQDTGS